MSFKVGNVVIQQNLVLQPHLNGTEGMIYEIRENWPVHGAVTGEESVLPIAYRIRWSDGRKSADDGHHIRLKRPPTKDDAEPRADFLPAEDDFTRDLLKQLGRVSA